MKKILFALSILSFISYGCNKNEDKATTAPGSDIQRQEAGHGQTTGFEKEEYRDDYREEKDYMEK